MKVKDWLQRRFKIVIDFKGTPHQLACAFGLGVALGIIPGTGALAAAATASVLRLNLPLMVAGALLTNPVTTPFVYAGSYLLGRRLLGNALPLWPAAKVLLAILIGNLILAIGLGLLGYGMALCFFLLVRRVNRT